ncbi:MAG: hypothetical protein J0M15_10995 [Deltaproteobacteria bacterium]|nr:hypothetical protein [Deltaproteobacteria bacterium]
MAKKASKVKKVLKVKKINQSVGAKSSSIKTKNPQKGTVKGVGNSKSVKSAKVSKKPGANLQTGKMASSPKTSKGKTESVSFKADKDLVTQVKDKKLKKVLKKDTKDTIKSLDKENLPASSVVEQKVNSDKSSLLKIGKVEKVKTEKVKTEKVKKIVEPKKPKLTKLEKAEIDQNAKWADLFEKFKAVKPVDYNMRDVFESNQPLMHKILGWGWILSSENDRLEVLFKDGKKILISNYKS